MYSALNEKKYCFGLFLDLKHDFDVCSDTVLLKKKLTKYGITGTSYDWFKTYLKERQQKEDKKNFTISVIQSSILGPLLFLLYIDPYSAPDLFEILLANETADLASKHDLKYSYKFVQ
jgi:hypothetical protein